MMIVIMPMSNKRTVIWHMPGEFVKLIHFIPTDRMLPYSNLFCTAFNKNQNAACRVKNSTGPFIIPCFDST